MSTRPGPAADTSDSDRSLPNGASTTAIPILTAGVILTAMLGSIHAFSVFLETFETTLEATRAKVSLIYSGALICLTIAVLFGHRLYRRWSPPVLTVSAAVGAAVGIATTGLSSNYWLVIFGYSVVFGTANGVGYGYALQFSAQALPQRQGFAMGLVTAFYAFGAAVAPFFFDRGLDQLGLQQTLLATAAVFVGLGTVAAVLLKRSGFSFQIDPNKRPAAEPADPSQVPTPLVTLLLWLGYGAGALSGLMVIGHATGIVESVGGSARLAVGATAAMAVGNMTGGLGAGALADRVPINWLLLGLPTVSALIMFGSSGIKQPITLAVVLVAIGLTYGAIIAAYPVAVLAVAGPAGSSKLYGRVFTSWGVAGLLGPWLAGTLFDATDSYRISFVVAGICGLVSAAAIACLKTTAARTPALSP